MIVIEDHMFTAIALYITSDVKAKRLQIANQKLPAKPRDQHTSALTTPNMKRKDSTDFEFLGLFKVVFSLS